MQPTLSVQCVHGVSTWNIYNLNIDIFDLVTESSSDLRGHTPVYDSIENNLNFRGLL